MDRSTREGFLRAIEERRNSPGNGVEDEVAPYRGLTLVEKGKQLRQVVSAGWKMLAARPDRERVLQFVEPFSADYYQILATRRERMASKTGSGSG